MIEAVIALSVTLAVCVIGLLFALYHQMLMVNEVNKRLIIIAEEAIEKERITMDELNRQLQDNAMTMQEKFSSSDNNENSPELFDAGFNPHEALDELE